MPLRFCCNGHSRSGLLSKSRSADCSGAVIFRFFCKSTSSLTVLFLWSENHGMVPFIASVSIFILVDYIPPENECQDRARAYSTRLFTIPWRQSIDTRMPS